jgi:hypothetical protein
MIDFTAGLSLALRDFLTLDLNSMNLNEKNWLFLALVVVVVTTWSCTRQQEARRKLQQLEML